MESSPGSGIPNQGHVAQRADLHIYFFKDLSSGINRYINIKITFRVLE